MNTQIIIIPKGTSVCPSEKGHNNFYYPKLDKCIIISKDIKVEQLCWVGGGRLSAYQVVGHKNIIWVEKGYIRGIE
tara:strand:- start:218 stop:445 length:228 start_codon:yes stop_codon:yes gene_type:complete